jgi:hypothetical protein
MLRRCKSQTPVLGVAVLCAMGIVLLTMLGQIIVTLTSAGLGHGSTSQGFHVVTLVKPLIHRNARDQQRHSAFKLGG